MEAIRLRPFQEKAIALLSGRAPSHLICVAPTGSGKSLIYEKLTADMRWRTLLITPLVALARQQADNLTKAGVLLKDGRSRLNRVVRRSEAWILSPESACSPRLLASLRAWKPDLVVIDECHCVWEWGRSFRPSFRLIPELIRNIRSPRSLWLTATLPLEQRERLRSLLPRPIHEIGSFELPPRLQLTIIPVPLQDRYEALLKWIQRNGDRDGIIFVPTRATAENLAARLSHSLRSNRVRAYHAGLSSEERLGIEAGVRDRRFGWIVATSAFGMGMDLPQIRWVVLWQAPPSLLALAQMLGRATRGTEETQGAVFWHPDDFRLLEWMASQENGALHLQTTARFLSRYQCRRQALEHFFEQSSDQPSCGNCDYCLNQSNT